MVYAFVHVYTNMVFRVSSYTCLHSQIVSSRLPGCAPVLGKLHDFYGEDPTKGQNMKITEDCSRGLFTLVACHAVW